MNAEPSLDPDGEECLDYDEEYTDEVELDEGDVQSAEEEEYEDEEQSVNLEVKGLSGEHAPTSPTLDASFASSMSIGTAPPTPLLANSRSQPVAAQRLIGHPTPPSQRHVSRTAPSASPFLPAHLFASNPDAHPPSSSPYRMDISPAPGSPTIAANFFNPPKPSNSQFDPFGTQSSSSHVLSSSPPTDRPTIGLKKTKSRARMCHGFFEPRSDVQQLTTSDDESERLGSDGMDIDSPGYSQPARNMFQPLVFVGDSSAPATRAPRAERSGSQGSIGKRSRSDDDDFEDSGSSSLGSDMRSVHMQHPRTRSDDGHSSGRQHLSPGYSHSSGRTRTMPETSLVSGCSRTLELPSSPILACSSSARFNAFDHSMSSSPSQMMSPSVKAAAKLTLGRKAGERSLSGFKFPVSKASTGAQVAHVRAGSSGSTSTRNTQYQPSAGGSLGASTLGGFPKRPTLGVVQSAATLFSRHQHQLSSASNSTGENDAQGFGTRQRDAVGRPASKSRRAISFVATERQLLMSDGGDEDEDEDDDGHAGFNCSPAPRGVSNTWPKYGLGGGHTRMASETVLGAQPRKRSPPPAPLSSLALAPPSRNMFQNMLQSPSALSPHQQKAMVGISSRTIESPVGMGFSEKERAGKILPCHKVSNDGLMRISPSTMDELLEGRYDSSISRKIVIDCRFRYEYEGGHIKNAVNVGEKDLAEEMLLAGKLFDGTLDVPEPSESGKCDGNGVMKKVVLVFHCEYSAMRAPTIAKHIREKDRHLNMPHYPALHYPEVYILEGGFASYFAHSPQHCDGTYVRMDDPSYRVDRHADLNSFRNKEFNRAKSFTYGTADSNGSGMIVKKKASKKVMRDENSIAEEDECSPLHDRRRFGKDEGVKSMGSLGRAGGLNAMRKLDSNSMGFGRGSLATMKR